MNTSQNQKKVCDAFGKHFARVSHRNTDAPFFQYREQEEKCNIDFKSKKVESYNMPFSMKALTSALLKCNDTAPGADDIPYPMLKNATDKLKLFLLDVINRIWQESAYPSMWELAIVLPFLKPSKESSIPFNYRPILYSKTYGKNG